MKRVQEQNMNVEQESTRVFEKTHVFRPGDLHRENASAGFQLDEETKELPLISGRFAGREWKVEELRREEQEKALRRLPILSQPRIRYGAAMLAGAALSFALLTGSLTARAAMTGLNDQAVEVSTQIHELREENDRLRTESAQLLDIAYAEEYATRTLGMQHTRREQVTYLEEQGQDRATVLGVRRGQGFTYFCSRMFDTLGEYLHS